MYNNKKSTKYYIYDCRKENYIRTCENFDELIEYIASFNYTPWWSSNRVYNRFLEDFNCTMKDTKYVCNFDADIYGDMLREYIVFDSMFRIIDVRLYEKEILSFVAPKNRKRKWSKPEFEYRYEKTKPEFRNGPVPNTGHKWRFRNYYRRPRTTQEIRYNSIPEYESFVRKKRRYIPTVYDDIPRNIYRSWKHQGKKRKQWM